jgi:NAD(P)-dependent dehydrogenase (short-subunit alcohol dehydrogenase family)
MTAFDYTNRIVLVTGATRGIGNAIALAFGKAGATVVALGRTQGGLEALDDAIQAAGGPKAVLVPFNLLEPEGLDALGAELFRRFGKLDVVVGAAGVLGPLTPVGHLEPKGWDQILATNLTANWRLIRAMDPLLRRADAGRAIFLTSSADVVSGRAFWGAYGASKAALESIVAAYADEMENTTVRAVCIDPGAVKTRMRALAYPGDDPAKPPGPEVIAPLALELGRPDRDLPPGVVRFRDWSAARG